MGSDDGLWKQTAELLRRRPGWVIQAVATPGAPTYWCFARGSAEAVSVQVQSGLINIQLGETDEIIALEQVSELVSWLSAHRPDSLQEPKRSLAEKFRAGKLFRWE